MERLRVGILGATGMVGQRFATLLEYHPWFSVASLAASAQSAGRRYAEATVGRWAMDQEMPEELQDLVLFDAIRDIAQIAGQVDLVFSALSLDQEATRQIESAYAAAGVAVVSNTAAHRMTPDVPMVLPEVNPEHLSIIHAQRRQHGFGSGLIAVKPNCSLQSYVPVIHALSLFEPVEAVVTTLQAVSGAGRRLRDWPEMADNVIPYISGEEQKSEQEPLKILGIVGREAIEPRRDLTISATCIRVPVSDGHLASLSLRFTRSASKQEIISALKGYENPLAGRQLPSAPQEFIRYFEEEDRPQTKLDRGLGLGMTISVGRLREDPVLGWKLAALSHNTLRGAAGGAVLLAELLVHEGYIDHSHHRK